VTPLKDLLACCDTSNAIQAMRSFSSLYVYMYICMYSMYVCTYNTYLPTIVIDGYYFEIRGSSLGYSGHVLLDIHIHSNLDGELLMNNSALFDQKLGISIF
jgi:hypothetical protein